MEKIKQYMEELEKQEIQEKLTNLEEEFFRFKCELNDLEKKNMMKKMMVKQRKN